MIVKRRTLKNVEVLLILFVCLFVVVIWTSESRIQFLKNSCINWSQNTILIGWKLGKNWGLVQHFVDECTWNMKNQINNRSIFNFMFLLQFVRTIIFLIRYHLINFENVILLYLSNSHFPLLPWLNIWMKNFNFQSPRISHVQ
jgi:hypothetical protein